MSLVVTPLERAYLEVLTDEQQLVANAIAAREDAEATEEGASPSRWREAESYSGLSERGWSVRRIAEECGGNKSSVAVFIKAVSRYPDTDSRPSFWHAYAESTGEKDEQLPVVADPGPLPEGVYRVVVADPPWQYDNKATRGAAEDHYSTMTIAELCDLDIEDRTADDAHLYLWTTNGFLREAFEVVEAWGFAYKTCITWVKPQMGMGNYFRSSTEHILFGVKGRLRTQERDMVNWFEAPRGKHSSKPGSFYDFVERASPGPYLELFARERRFGWDGWGNEA